MEPMMLAILILVLAVLDIRAMIKAKLAKEAAVYALLMVVTVSIGILYFSDPYRKSISVMFLELFRIKF